MKLYQLLLAMCLMPTLLFAQSYGVEVEVVSEDIGTLVALDGTETDLSGYSLIIFYFAFCKIMNCTFCINDIGAINSIMFWCYYKIEII